MQCFWPVSMKNPNGFGSINRRCGSCLGCKVSKRNEWTGRILLESFLHDFSSFVTLTYRNEALPINNSVSKKDLQKFIMRLRSIWHRDDPRHTGLRYFACAEYGDTTERPHYHIVIFGIPHWRGDIVRQAWPDDLYGFTQIGELTPERARYVAKYTTKKLSSQKILSDGRVPEFALMSKKPGLGVGYLPKIAVILSALNSKLEISSSACGHSNENSWRLWKNGVPDCWRYQGKNYNYGYYLKRKLYHLLGVSTLQAQGMEMKKMSDINKESKRRWNENPYGYVTSMLNKEERLQKKIGFINNTETI